MTLSREEQLSQLSAFINEADKEITMILQRLHWDRETLLKSEPMVNCKYDINHRIPLRTRKEHEEICFLKSQGYQKDDLFLPEPLDTNASTIVKFSPMEIEQIINNASINDPTFKKGRRNVTSHPLTVEQLAATYTADERRAIHDAVVNKMPSFHDLSDLALTSASVGSSEEKSKSRLEVLAELRDMRRRRAKYRVPGAASNYSNTLRALIATQMELFTETKPKIKIEPIDEDECNAEYDYNQASSYPDKTLDVKPEINQNEVKVEEHSSSRDPGRYRRDGVDRERRRPRVDEDRYSHKHTKLERHERYSESNSKERDSRHSYNDERERQNKHRDYRSRDYSPELHHKKRHHKHHQHRSDRDRHRVKVKEEQLSDSEHTATRYYDLPYSNEERGHSSRDKSKRGY